MTHQTWKFRKAIRPLFADPVTYLVNIPEPVQYKIYALALPFDLRCESGTYRVKQLCILN